MEKQIPFRFDVYLDGQTLWATSDPELRLGKVRVFYKHSNRNGSYITDEFAAKLALSAYHKPLIGTYNVLRKDFEGHEGAEQAKAYGYVLPNTLTWENHLDNDGVMREYATYEILVWAKYWEEASEIFSKTQSMEIDPATIRGSWQFMDGKDYEEFVYSEGVIAGLCILGNEKTPCFQGAAFFSTSDESYIQFTNAIKNYYGGKVTMNVKVAGLEHEHFEKIWNALNPNFCEEGAYSIEKIPVAINEQECVAFSCDTNATVITYAYSLDNAGNVTLEETSRCDYAAQADELREQIGQYEAKDADFEQQIASLQADVAAARANGEEVGAAWENKYNTLFAANEELRGDFEKLQGEFAEAQQALAAAQEELASVQQNFNAQAEALLTRDATIEQYSATIAEYEKKEKDAIIAKFSTCLPADVIQGISERKDTLTIDGLNTALALEYTKFSMAKDQKQDFHIPQDPEESHLVRILKAYKK